MPKLPDSKVAKRYGVCVRTLVRWDKQPELGFPPAIYINGRRYRDSDALDEFDAARVRESMERGPKKSQPSKKTQQVEQPATGEP